MSIIFKGFKKNSNRRVHGSYFGIYHAINGNFLHLTAEPNMQEVVQIR